MLTLMKRKCGYLNVKVNFKRRKIYRTKETIHNDKRVSLLKRLNSLKYGCISEQGFKIQKENLRGLKEEIGNPTL